MKVIQAELKNYNRRADNSVSLRLDSLIELSSADIAEVDSHRGQIAIVVLTDSLVGNDVDISDTQRYKMCGNGVVVNVVDYVYKLLKEGENEGR